MIQRQHLVGEVGDDQADAAGVVIVGGVNAHAGAGDTVFAESHAGRNGFFFERAIVFIQIKLIGLSVIGEDDVGPAVVVVIENGDTQALRRWIIEMCFLCSVFKFAVAEIVPQSRRRTFVRLRCAVGLVGAVEGAEEITWLRPLNIIRDHQIEFTVAIVVHPRRAGGELVRPPQSCGLCHIRESAVAVVVKKMALAERGDENIVEAVVVVVTDGNAKSEYWNG